MIVFNSFWILVSLFVIYTEAKSIEIDENDAWEEFKKEYNKQYSTESEDQQRKATFEENSKLIKEHNEQNHQFRLKMNQFGDLTHEEFIRYLSFTPATPTNQNDSDGDSTDDALLLDNTYPKAIDLRKTGCVSEVKNQGDRPNKISWAFSVAGAIEGQVFKTEGKCLQHPVQSLSELFLIDCQNENGVGTEFDKALELVRQRGIYTEELYKLVKKLDVKCPEENYPIRASVLFEVLTIKEATVGRMIKEIYGHENSVPATVDASHQSFQFYHTGVYNEQKCDIENQVANQAVLIVGYDETDSNAKHWLVKNSWGKSWGEAGYMKIAYGTCGIEKEAYIVTSAKCSCGSMKASCHIKGILE
ncbi:procathepsin L-like [Planococcus citri]|uniref:procathepsin L-like n=1 Tax=Planococcus citri TaxID=170843 RepID=UPI0031F933F4